MVVDMQTNDKLLLFHNEVVSYSEGLLDIFKIIRGWGLAAIEDAYEIVI